VLHLISPKYLMTAPSRAFSGHFLRLPNRIPRNHLIGHSERITPILEGTRWFRIHYSNVSFEKLARAASGESKYGIALF
jgi:hypothetical protein